jgi:SAM-dependent methyltransferase
MQAERGQLNRPPQLYGSLAFVWHVFSPPEDYEEECATFRRTFQANGVREGGSLLHLGSGGGSVDWHLKQHYRMAGVDLSPDMVAQASAVNPEVIYVVGDMRNVRLHRTFDAVLIHDAIAYMTTPDQLAAAYRTAAAHLGPGGVLISIPEELRSRMPLESTVTTVERDGVRLDVMESYHDADPADHEFEAVFVFLIRRGEELHVEVDRHTVGVHSLDEYLAAADEAGFDARAEPWELSDWGDAEPLPLIVGIRR